MAKFLGFPHLETLSEGLQAGAQEKLQKHKAAHQLSACLGGISTGHFDTDLLIVGCRCLGRTKGPQHGWQTISGIILGKSRAALLLKQDFSYFEALSFCACNYT